VTTKHTHKVVFGKRVKDRPRYQELNNGAEPIRWRTGNTSGYPTTAQTRAHNCRQPGYGPVCTYGDY
jgi:hypothetical protein